jgi:hypothetical protein
MASKHANIDGKAPTHSLSALAKAAPVSQQDGTSVEQQADILVSQEAGATVKVTYHLNPETVARLDQARVRLVTLATAGRGPEQTRGARRRINLSAIVNAALAAALDDLDATQSESRLAISLVQR